MAGGPSLHARFFLPFIKLWVPRPCVLCKGGYDAAGIVVVMRAGLHRIYGANICTLSPRAKPGRYREMLAGERSLFSLPRSLNIKTHVVGGRIPPSQPARKTGHPQVYGFGHTKAGPPVAEGADRRPVAFAALTLFLQLGRPVGR